VPPSLNFPQLDFVKPPCGFHPMTWERVSNETKVSSLFKIQALGILPKSF